VAGTSKAASVTASEDPARLGFTAETRRCAIEAGGAPWLGGAASGFRPDTGTVPADGCRDRESHRDWAGSSLVRRSHLASDAAATLFATAMGCAALAVMALGLDIAACLQERSVAPSWVDPLSLSAWPRAAQVGWWLSVSAAVLCSRLLMHRAGFRQRPTVVALWVGPFVVLAAGVPAGAAW